MKINFFDTDSYKIGMWKQLPANTSRSMSYLEARGGGDHIKFVGLQYVLQQLEVPTVEEVKEVQKRCLNHFGRDDVFNYDGWMQIAKMRYLPLKVRSVPEGGVYPTSMPLVTVENTLPGFEWLVTWFETQIMRVWYPTTVATRSWEIKQLITDYLELNGAPESIGFKLQDFGSRGVSSSESAAIGGFAHLTNFMGTDTLAGWEMALEYYRAKPEEIGYSISASEHSVISAWSKDGERDAFANMIEQFGGDGKLYACVSDTYNIWNALEIWKSLEDDIIAKGGTLVIRPDSGDPVETPIKVVKRLIELFGSTNNDKGFKVLPSYIRVIQGDGVEYESIRRILEGLHNEGISSDNIVFGMGGKLLQSHSRDDFKFAYKMCAITVDGEERDVYKDPITDPSKRSKAGYLTVDADCCTIRERELRGVELMETIWQEGRFLKEVTLSDLRKV